MFIPNTMPSTLAEMLAFLLPTVEDGLFDSVAYDDDENPTKIVCTQGGNTILEFTVASDKWTITPYTATDTPAIGTSHVFENKPIGVLCRCSGGLYIRADELHNSRIGYLIAAKTSSGKTGFFGCAALTSVGHSFFNGARTVYSTTFGDSTTLALYTHGYNIGCTYTANYPNDRTILSRVPVVGTIGSTDYFTTAFIRSMVQFAETGEQIIGGKKYWCDIQFAVLDE